jgi:hypothetical protein
VASVAASAAHDGAERALAANPIEAHPWLSLLKDVTALPVFRDKRDSVMATFAGLFAIVQSVSPTVIDRIREAYAADGVGGVRTLLARAIEKKDEDDLPPELQRLVGRRPDKLSASDWRTLAGLDTLADAREVTRYDQKTIDKYLAKHKIVPGWRRAPRRSRASPASPRRRRRAR